MENLPIILAGHSHRNALGVPLDNVDEHPSLQLSSNNDRRFFGLAGRPCEKYWRILCEYAPGREIALLWDGNQYNGHYLIQTNPLFDVYVKEQSHLPLDETRLIVPERALRMKFSNSAERLQKIVFELYNCGAKKVALVSGPPPKANEDTLRELIIRETYFVNHAAALGINLKTVALTPAAIRLKLWQVEQNTLQEALSASSYLYVPPPMAACDKFGYLKQEFWASDATHANKAYGHLMREEIWKTFITGK